MPVQAVTKQAIAHDNTGFNITDASFQTMTTGSGNGSQWDWATDDIVVVKNDTGGAAVVTFKLSAAAKAQATQYGATTPDPTKSIANGKTHLFRLDQAAFKETTNKVTIECDVAAKVAVLSPG
jgi:hypothetical protein